MTWVSYIVVLHPGYIVFWGHSESGVSVEGRVVGSFVV